VENRSLGGLKSGVALGAALELGIDLVGETVVTW
jgi:hypothetical protein